MTSRRREAPLKRTNPSGRVVWVARYTGRDGKRRSAGTYALKREAQDAIHSAYDREYGDGKAPRQVGTVDAYVQHWGKYHPRAHSTAKTYEYNLTAALDVRVGGRPLRDWRVDDVERSEIAELVHYLLVEKGRAANGARAILRTLSAMWEDAIMDGWAKHNPVMGLKIRQSDPRVTKPTREPRVFSWEEMHSVQGGPQAVAMLGCLSDLGMRLGEMLPLERGDVFDDACPDPDCRLSGPHVHVRRTAEDGVTTPGTKTTRNSRKRGREAPLGPRLHGLLRELPPRLDTRLLFPAQKGGVMQNRLFYQEVWRPAVGHLGDCRPHDFRHSFVSLMRAAGVDPADLAAWTGHSVLVATGTYTHSVGSSVELARSVMG